MTDKKLDQILKQALATEINDTEIRVYKRKKNKMRKFEKIGKAVAAAAAIGIIGICGLGYSNPALAAKIPLIGSIFEKIENNVRYPGDYSSRGSILTNNADASDYSVSDKGVTLTASEVYCDGYSVFLTMYIEAEDADFTLIPEYYVGINAADNRKAAGFYINGSWRINGNSFGQLMNNLDGTVIDSHTFAGMLKVDLEEKIEGNGSLSLNITGLGYDDVTMLDREDIFTSHWTDGNWNVDIPFEASADDIKTIKVGKKEGDITLDDVEVSPYQVIVHTTAPGQRIEPTEEEVEKLHSQRPEMTKEAIRDMLGMYLNYPSIIVFNQDGKMLLDEGIPGNARFAVQGEKIETLYIFMFYDSNDKMQMADEGMSSDAADRADFAAEIRVQ